jgi:hypothetical protein
VSQEIQKKKKKCTHNLTKEKSMLYVSTKFNYTSQVEYKWNKCTVNGGAQIVCH